MTKDNIVTLPNEVLRHKSKRITNFDGSFLSDLADDMIAATLDWEDSREHEFGAALAAVQVGKLYRVVVVRRNFDDKNDRHFDVLVNPKIVKSEGEPVADLEGCLSVKNLYGRVKRFPKVKVKAQDINGKETRLNAEGFLARVLQHEIDHTNGLLFTDRVDEAEDLLELQDDGSFTKLQP